MKLYLLRHGVAEDAAPGVLDAERSLTDDGRDKLAAVLRRAAEAGVCPDVILTSPYARSLQSAEMAKEALQCPRDLVQDSHLTPHSDPDDAWKLLRDYRGFEQVMIVGHNPHLSWFAGVVIGAQGGGVEMKKGALACLQVGSLGAAPRGSLTWLLTPRLAGT